MGIVNILAKPFARYISKKVEAESRNPLLHQNFWFKTNIEKAQNTAFGKDHHFKDIQSYQLFKENVPVRDYEQLRMYLDRIVAGEKDVLWPGNPIYLAKTSGTTSGVKYIPITKDSIPFHISSARNALLAYIAETGKSEFLTGKLIFFSGSPKLETKNGILVGRLSGIVNHHVPAYLRKSQMPSYITNCIEDWEEKVDAIVEETVSENMTLISGIPPWVQMYFDKIQAKTGKLVRDIFPNFFLFVYGGVNFEPYRAKIEASVGRKLDTIETYPASEGFIAYQDSQKDEGLLLLVNNGVFYEFIPTEEYFNENPTRIMLQDVKLEVNYALILNTNAGLFGYSIGDTIKFVSLNPYRIKVTGRIKHYISAFGEHMIGEEVDGAAILGCQQFGINLTEFTVAPQVNPPEGGLPYHEWFVSLDTIPENLQDLAANIDLELRKKNIYYSDLVEGAILRPLKLNVLKQDAFIQYMKSEGKLGGQNKVPRLSNDRKIADKLQDYIMIRVE